LKFSCIGTSFFFFFSLMSTTQRIPTRTRSFEILYYLQTTLTTMMRTLACCILLLVNHPSVSAFSALASSSIQQQHRLFEFRADGTETNDRLPSLNRPLDIGIPCYFLPEDGAVQRLLQNSNANSMDAMDACWALEACRGDQVRAVWHILQAQQQQDHLKLPSTTVAATTAAATALDLHSYQNVPLHLMFRRQVQKRARQKVTFRKLWQQSKHRFPGMSISRGIGNNNKKRGPSLGQLLRRSSGLERVGRLLVELTCVLGLVRYTFGSLPLLPI
jgi:hypothetical protein